MPYFVRLNNPLCRSIETVVQLCSHSDLWEFVSTPDQVNARGVPLPLCLSPAHPLNTPKALRGAATMNAAVLLAFLDKRLEVIAFDPIPMPFGLILSARITNAARGESLTLELCRWIFHEAKNCKTFDGQSYDSEWLNRLTDHVIAPLTDLGYLQESHLRRAKARAETHPWGTATMRDAIGHMREICTDLKRRPTQ